MISSQPSVQRESLRTEVFRSDRWPQLKNESCGNWSIHRKERQMRAVLIIVSLFIVLLEGDPTGVNAQQLRDTFRRVKGSVVVVRTTEKTVAPYPLQGILSLPGLASGVLISDDGKVLTAAHAVQAVDRLAVEFADGRKGAAHGVSAAGYAGVALPPIDPIPSGPTSAPPC